jgi:hypothetical protein
LDSNALSRETESLETHGLIHTEHQEGCHPQRACGVPEEIDEDEQDEINLNVDPQVSDPRNEDDYDTWEYGTEPISHAMLADKIMPLVPADKWEAVQTRFVSLIVDQMPAKVLKQLTGDFYGFEKAEQLLTNYYTYEDNKSLLIEDALRYLGDQVACYELDLICET